MVFGNDHVQSASGASGIVQFDVGAAAGHVGGDGDCSSASRF